MLWTVTKNSVRSHAASSPPVCAWPVARAVRGQPSLHTEGPKVSACGKFKNLTSLSQLVAWGPKALCPGLGVDQALWYTGGLDTAFTEVS